MMLLIVLVAIFWYMKGRPLSQWPTIISLNATVAILTTGCSATLMFGVSEFVGQLKWLHFKNSPHELRHFERFDEASRGPLGSLKFLFKVKWNLATLGALLTVTRLAFAPLAQQVVSFEQRLVMTPDDYVTFGYSHSYYKEIQLGLFNHDVGSTPQDPEMQAAIVQGLYNISTTATFDCPGACAWTGTWVTLGFASECSNVTQQTLSTEICRNETAAGYHKTCTMVTPSGVGITVRRQFTDWLTNYYMNATASLHEYGFNAALERLPEIFRFAVYRSTGDHNFEPTNVNITQCSISLAAYRYTNARANGSTFSFDQTEEISLHGGAWSSIDSTFRFAGSEAEDMPGLEMGHFDLLALGNFLTSRTIVNEWVDGNFPNDGFGLSAALSGDVDLDGRFERMAASMTDYIRMGPNHQTATGERLDSETYVAIRWVFLIGPFVIEGGGMVFVVASIIVNRRSTQVPLWKSSALAVLACQHDKASGVMYSEERDMKEATEAAGKTFARLT
ncbi:hypothetical protein B0I35DRAFT_379378 [Stachybotrys elegans]|uniref:Uncharacterized protein n=1 Tax=Stachybotrys elegans TaxID=80388 RepID=A0A8K0WNT1_9HYPO|nr:hypothetical protein B0I35DRAFT_379378 [Stachybotrys elegans]